MLKLLLICLVLHLTHGQHTVLASSSTSTTIISPEGSYTLEPSYLNTNQANLIPGAYWIWNSGDTSEVGTTVVFNKNLYISCTGPITLTIAAFGTYSVWWDYANVQNGSNYLTATQISLQSYCGNHNLTIQVTKTSADAQAGLIFSLSQDQSGCYSCSANAYWSESFCSCQCLSFCDCPTNKHWVGYPTCACICPPRIIIPWPPRPIPIPIPRPIPHPIPPPIEVQTAANTTASKSTTSLKSQAPATSAFTSELAIRFWFCPIGQYYNAETCSCRCHYQYCPPGQYFNDDPSSGGCRCYFLLT